MKKTKAVAAIMLMIAVFFAFGCEKDINDYKITVNTFIPRDIMSQFPTIQCSIGLGCVGGWIVTLR